MNEDNMVKKTDFNKITTKYEDVKKQTTEEYFNNNQFSIDAFNKKYSMFIFIKSLPRICIIQSSLIIKANRASLF